MDKCTVADDVRAIAQVRRLSFVLPTESVVLQRTIRSKDLIIALCRYLEQGDRSLAVDCCPRSCGLLYSLNIGYRMFGQDSSFLSESCYYTA